MRLLALVVALLFPLQDALAQQGRQKQQQMSPEQRQRLRQDMREVYKERNARPERPRQMAPQERERLRRDVDEANRRLKR